MIIPFEVLKAACACRDMKGRPLMKIINVASTGEVTATNGRVLYVSNPVPQHTEMKFIFPGTPKKCHSVSVERELASGLDVKGVILWRVFLDSVQTDFPNFKDIEWEKSPVSHNEPVVFMPEVLELITKSFKKGEHVEWCSGGSKTPTRVTGTHGVLWIMPCNKP